MKDGFLSPIVEDWRLDTCKSMREWVVVVAHPSDRTIWPRADPSHRRPRQGRHCEPHVSPRAPPTNEVDLLSGAKYETD
jgi:hypothetical protein